MPRTLFVGAAPSAIAWYRCALPAMALGQDWVAGVQPDVDVLEAATGVTRDGNAARPADYDVIVLQLAAGLRWLHIIRAWQRSGITVLYEVDDWIRGVRRNRDHDFRDVVDRKQAEDSERCMAVCDGVICSTEWLARRYRKVNPNTFVCRNGLDLKRYAITRPARDQVAIGWAGATGHGSGVRGWMDAVRTLMREREDTRFISVGQPFADELAPEFGVGRALSVPFALLDTYPATMALFDIALAPAGKGSFFKGKSDLRWLEASALGIPVIGDPGVYPEIEHGVTGFHAETPEEVEALLRMLVEEPDLRERVGAAARAHVAEHRRIEIAAGRWAEVLTDARSSRPALTTDLGPTRTPRVSVVIPAYNYADYVGAAIESAFDPDMAEGEIEVIVVDDGSTDHTPEVLAGFGDRITVVRQENAGIRAATNAGLERARGEFVALLGADDLFVRGRTRKMIAALEAHPRAGLVYGDMSIVDATGRVTHPSFRTAAGVRALSGDCYGQLMTNNVVSGGAAMFRRELLGADPLSREDRPEAEDWYIACRIAEASELLAIPDVVTLYRLHGANTNLGADAAQQRRLVVGELPFRRWLLHNADARKATSAELLSALAMFDVCRTGVGPADGASPLVDDEARFDAAMAESERTGDQAATIASLVRAAAACPEAAAPRERLAELLEPVPTA